MGTLTTPWPQARPLMPSRGAPVIHGHQQVHVDRLTDKAGGEEPLFAKGSLL